jgi:hypothetical protein
MKGIFLLPVVLAGLTACSAKKEALIETSPPVAEPISRATSVTATSNPAEPVMTLPQVTEAVQNRQYDRAVEGLAGLKAASAQMTDAQRLQYQQAVRKTRLIPTALSLALRSMGKLRLTRYAFWAITTMCRI